ncbi:TPA: tape measure protein [Haemophilus influenzae]
MSSLGSLNILLSLDSIQFNQALDKSSYQTQKFAKQFELNFTKAQAKAKQFSERTTQYLNNIEKAANTINKTTSRTFWAGIVSSGGSYLSSGISDVIKYADSYTELQNRIRLVTNSQTAMVAATESVFDISLKTNQAVGATAQIYQRFAQNADRLNLSQLQVSELTETVAKSVAISGASASAAEAALTQFGQALASGVFRGDEFNSVMEQTPGLATAIAKGLGGTTGELRIMAGEGKLTAKVLIEALEKARDSVDKDFSKRVLSLGDAFTNLQTAAIKTTGQLDQSLGITTKLAQGVDFLSQHLEGAASAATILLTSLSVSKLSQFTIEKSKATIATAKHTNELYKEAQAVYSQTQALRVQAQADIERLHAELQLAQSEKTRFALRERLNAQSQRVIALVRQEADAKRQLAVATSLAGQALNGLKGIMALLGGPIGVITLAAGALFYFGQQAKEARAAALDMTDVNNQLAESYDKLSEAALSLKITEQLDKIKDQYKKIEKLQDEMSTRQIGTDFDGFQVGGGLDEKEVDEFLNKISFAQEKAEKMKQVFDKMLSSMGQSFLRSGKNVEELKEKFRLLGIDGETADRVIAGLQNNLGKVGESAEEAADKTLDLSEAMKKLNDKSTTLAQKLEVAKLKQQGQAKSAYVLAGLYELLGKEGALYNEVLIGIATGTITAANAADKAVGLSVETLNKILEGKALLEKNFANETAITTIETNIKGTKSSENARDSWLSFYDEIRKKSSSSLGEIELEQARMFQRLEEHNKKGVVTYQEYETAKTAIAERFARQRLELAGKYAPEKLLKANLNDDLKSIQELYSAGQLNQAEAAKAAQRAQFDYAQSVSQSAVDPLAQFRAQFDPNQEIENQRMRDLALLEAMQSGNEQKLLSEEEYQRRKKEIQDKYDLERQKKESDYYAQSTQMMSSAFDTMAGVMANAAGQQSAAYKAMFAASKAFAIAESIINIQLALSEAAKLPYPANLVEYARVASQTASIVSNIQSVTMSFATGGYTGDGGKYTPAGIVHKGEYVITKEATARLGRGFLDHLNYGSVRRGFANGGGVGVPRLSTMAYQPKSSGNIAVKVINNGEPMEVRVSREQHGDQVEITVELMKKIADSRIAYHQQESMRQGGAFAR